MTASTFDQLKQVEERNLQLRLQHMLRPTSQSEQFLHWHNKKLRQYRRMTFQIFKSTMM
jgi:hypothetical protein